MATTQVKCFCMDVEDRPGVLAEISRTLLKGKTNLKGIWGWGMGGGKAQVYAVAQNADKFKKVAAAAGWSVSECQAVSITGKDQVGALVKNLDALEKAGVNIRFITAAAVSGKFSAYVWAEPGREQDLRRALGAK